MSFLNIFKKKKPKKKYLQMGETVELHEKIAKHTNQYRLVIEEIPTVGEKLPESYGGTCHRVDHRTILYICIDGTFVFDLINKRISKLKSKRKFHTWSHCSHITEDRKKVVCFGGADKYEKGTIVPSNVIYEYNIVDEKWSERFTKGQFPKSRRGAASFLKGNKLYIFGGVAYYLMTTKDMDVFELDLDTYVWKKYSPERQPVKRYSHCACLIDKDRALMGFGQFDSSYNDVYLFYINSKKWYRRDTFGPSPSPRAYTSVNKYGSNVYFFGGRFMSEDRFNSFHVLSLTTWNWREIELNPHLMTMLTLPKIAGHATVVVGNKLVVMGGNCENMKKDGKKYTYKSDTVFEICLPDTLAIDRSLFIDTLIHVTEY